MSTKLRLLTVPILMQIKSLSLSVTYDTLSALGLIGSDESQWSLTQIKIESRSYERNKPQ